MLKKIIKKISVILMMLAFMSVPVMSFASSSNDFNPTEVKPSSQGTQYVLGISNTVFKVATAIGIVVSVIVLVIMGIRYMAGSPEEKNNYKNHFFPYLVGAVLVFAASSIASMLYYVFQKI